jgi:hypothetical protein
MAEFSMSIDKLMLVNGFRTSRANAETDRKDLARQILVKGDGKSNGTMAWAERVREFMLIDFRLDKGGVILAQNCYIKLPLDYIIHTSPGFWSLSQAGS